MTDTRKSIGPNDAGSAGTAAGAIADDDEEDVGGDYT
jgi:hypothetical protein